MKSLSLKERLVKYLLKQHGFVASGDIQRIVMQHTTYTPRTTVRRLQELFEEGKLEREIRKGHAFYRVAQINPPCGNCHEDQRGQTYCRSQKMVRLFDLGKPASQIFSVV